MLEAKVTVVTTAIVAIIAARGPKDFGIAIELLGCSSFKGPTYFSVTLSITAVARVSMH